MPEPIETQNEPEVIALAKKLRYECTALQGKITELLRMLADLNLEPADPGAYKCQCGFAFKTQDRLDQHRHNVHGEGEPAPLTKHEEQAV